MFATTSTNPYRQKLYKKLAEWGVTGGETHSELVQRLLGLDGLPDKMTDEQNRLCEMLSGEHGWAVYKMLLVRRSNG